MQCIVYMCDLGRGRNLVDKNERRAQQLAKEDPDSKLIIGNGHHGSSLQEIGGGGGQQSCCNRTRGRILHLQARRVFVREKDDKVKALSR